MLDGESVTMTSASKINGNGARIAMARMTRHLMAPLAFAALTITVAPVFAQGTFPAPLPGQPDAPTTKAVPFAPMTVPMTGAAPPAGDLSDACNAGFFPLREDAERRAQRIRAAGEHHASSAAACILMRDYSQSEIRLIQYVQANAVICRIPPHVAEQLGAGHKTTESLLARVCSAAQSARPYGQDRFGPPGPVGDFDSFDRSYRLRFNGE
jgi:hypothetical protein